MLFLLTACSSQQIKKESKVNTTAQVATVGTTEEKNMNKITIKVGGREFAATLYDNKTAKEFASRLPLTVDMQELHGNEKYCYLDSALPTEQSVPDSIKSGDLKLFGDDCLVVFYESFSTSYSYTDIGQIDNPDGLKDALGSENVTVTFELKD